MLFTSLHEDSLVYGAGEKLAKFWMINASVIIGINLFLILTLLQMSPKLQVVAQILEPSPMSSVQLLQTEPFSEDFGSKKIIDEAILRFYLDSRYITFQDKDEMSYRWGPRGPVAFFSSPDVYKKFTGKLADKLTGIAGSKASKNIDILSISRAGRIYTVEFILYTYERGKISKSQRIAVIEIDYSPAKRSFNVLHSNPFGMYIKNFTETIKK